MFTRSLQVKLVKTPKAQTKTEPPVDKTADYAQIARDAAVELTKGVILVTTTYVVLDTLRQVTVTFADHYTL